MMTVVLPPLFLYSRVSDRIVVYGYGLEHTIALPDMEEN